ncbi:universal stress protein [Actinoplanes sp. TRM 88003]|uniref:Universal stress protein n=1 Tax=Paractinoplanes aksuensis TaxID=2939490 RepID=A0ABT1DY61_9ACTN|nr:universal stress protein [Actinoplanes aksuensis]MCO8274870.1 universal stress protein [Actinoplanes aksuensis]
MGPSTILVGVDGSTSSLRAAAYAAGLARRQGSRLVAVYVRTPPSALLPLADTGGVAATVIDTQDAVEQELRTAFAERVGDLDARLVVRNGEPYAELCDTAREVQADVVVVGRSAALLHRVAGSIGHKLVRCGRWPVTVVP